MQAANDLLPGFQTRRFQTAGAQIHAAVGGDGPPLLLLHGNPLTHVSWHKVAPALARHFTVVAPDLRGYGDSSKPDGGDDHAGYSFRAMGEDNLDLMRQLGFKRFAVAGHDRGARVAFRMALDAPDTVERVAALDIVPTHHVLTHVTLGWGLESYHWFFMAQKAPFPEKLLCADLPYYIDYKLNKKGVGLSIFDARAMAEYKRCTTPEQIHAVCEDYRATVSVDFEMDSADFGKRRLACPVLVIWGANSHCGRHFKPMQAWSEWADDLRGFAVPTGHYPAEQRPDLVGDAFEAFFHGREPAAPPGVSGGALSALHARRLVDDGAELAFLDVREAGEFGEGHPLFAVPCPYSRLEALVPRLVPRRDVRVLLVDDGDGVASRAAHALESLGYPSVHWIDGGAPAWAAAGFTLFKGVNVPSKTLGELAEHAWQPATIDAATLARWRDQGRSFRLFDARPPAEYAKLRVPGAVCLPNGELAHRFPVAAGDTSTPVVVTCAGRTRGIIGVLGLRLAGIEGPIYALENGTQGWQLAGFELERDNAADPFPMLDAAGARATRERADALLARHRILELDCAGVQRWRADPSRTTYLFDLRSPEEVAADPLPAFVPAPSGQLVQATDQWVGVRHARLLLLDDLGLRAGLAAFWLRALGFDVAVARLTDELRAVEPAHAAAVLPEVPLVSAATALRALRSGASRLLDTRRSNAYRSAHVAGAQWAIRPRLERLDLDRDTPVHLVGDEAPVITLVALELRALGVATVACVEGGHAALQACGAALASSPDSPGRDAAIDFLEFVHDRHDGNLESSRRYLAWEQGLLAQLDAAERDAFALHDAAAH